MTSLLSRELNDPRTQLYPITVGQYHRMMRQGIIEEGTPFELLDGAIVRKDRSAQGEDPMTVGNEHIYCVALLQRLDERLRRRGVHVRTQQPISVPPVSEPEPDGAVVRGTIDDYASRLPQSKDILFVVEVADASLRRDRTTKLNLYARAAIAVYFIVNLPERVIEMYSEPVRGKGTYARTRVLKGSEKVRLPTGEGKTMAIAVRDLLPPATSVPARRKRSAS